MMCQHVMCTTRDTHPTQHSPSGELRRILTTPFGAETTNPYWFPDINGFNYITAAVQHPYGESDSDQIMSNTATGPAGYVGAWAFAARDFTDGASLQFQSVPYPGDDFEKHQVRR